MSDRHLRTSLAALACGLLLLAASCGDEDPTADLNATMGQAAESPSPDLDPMAGAPTEGSCYSLTRTQSQASTSTKSPLASCYDEHNSVTYHVGLFPEDATASDVEQVRRQCQKRLAAATGLSQDTLLGTVISWLWFEPTTNQWGAGARWFRCDAVAVVDSKLKVLPNTSSTTGIFTDNLEDRFVRCLRREADTDGDGDDEPVYLTCDKPHDYRWAGAFPAKKSSDYPSRKKFMTYARDRCPEIAGTKAWWATWPLEDEWKNGQRRLSCYKETSS